MLKGRSRDPRFTGTTVPGTPGHLDRPASQTIARPTPATHLTVRTPTLSRAPQTKPEPEYEVVEFPTDQYMNAKLQAPPPPPPRPPTGHPIDAGASCGLCGGGGARVRCAECGRRALCASCDDMYHRHPKRRHHQRQALSTSQLRDERPPLPPKTTPPVPPPRRHKISGDRMSASPRPPSTDQRRATLGHLSMGHNQTSTLPLNNYSAQHTQQIPPHLQVGKLSQPSVPSHLGSMPYLPTTMHAPAPVAHPPQTNTMGHPSWGRQRGSLPGFHVPPNMINQPMPAEAWDHQEPITHGAMPGQSWCRPLRRGASVLELPGTCGGCGHCAPTPWRYGSCANLEAGWAGWPPPGPCCVPHTPLPLLHGHPAHTPQPYRRADSRAVSRAASRTGSRAASPAMSVRSRASRRTKHRTPSPPPLPSSDADSESEDSDRAPPQPHVPPHAQPQSKEDEDDLGPPPAPPSVSWQCEFCTYVNEPGVRVCCICCRTPTTVPKVMDTPKVADVTNNISRLKVQDKRSPSPARFEEARVKQNGASTKGGQKKERTSTGCGPSPPRDDKLKKPINRLVTPIRDSADRIEQKTKHDTGVGPSPPREVLNSKQKTPERHSVSVGPSPPRDNVSLRSSRTSPSKSMAIVERKSSGTSPPRSGEGRPSSAMRANVSNTGTSPPPQSISTQTYEVPNSWERAPSVSQPRSRARRRFRDDARRERSHSRHSMSSDTRESERSARTSRDGRWEWRERDSSPGAEWSDGERRRAGPLRRRASHLDLHRARPARRSSIYGSGAGSPEPISNTRAISMEALVGAGARREAERGLELARLMTEAERLGFSAAEVHAALAQSPATPLTWLRERWPSLCAGVRAAAARLAPHSPITELEARAALARHRGAMWPAVTDCVERHRRQAESLGVGEEGRHGGRVWGSPAGADDDAAPPRRDRRAEDSSDEFDDRGPSKFQDDDWMYLPLDTNTNNDFYGKDETWKAPTDTILQRTEDVALKLKSLLLQAGVPAIDENLLIQGLLSDNAFLKSMPNELIGNKSQYTDFIQSENDFIDAYNALTRLSPLPNVNKSLNEKENVKSDMIPTVGSSMDETKSNNNTTVVNNVHIQESGDSPLQASGLYRELPQESIVEKAAFKIPVLNVAEITHEKIDDDEEIAIADITETHVSHTATVTHEPDENKIDNTVKASPVVSAVTTSQVILIKTKKMTNPAEENTFNRHNEMDEKYIQSLNRVVLEEEASIPQSSKNYTNNSPTRNNFVKQEEEKSNNLNDIVGNTQKLIQQMKEEINSDINSIEDSNISQSEADTSSNESEFSSEHESSYSETEEDTDNLTSNEEEEESNTDDEDDQITERHKIGTRTSSEDNEQFEEAMDHIDGQIEDFKNTNIEILDSIARSLQEEHTISVEINDNKGVKSEKQDKNNNTFLEVNSFEEIYDQLTSKSNNATTSVTKVSNENQNILNQNAIEYNIIEKPIIPKQEISISLFKPVTATKLIITEQKTQILHAIAEYTKDVRNIEDIPTRVNIQNSNEDTNDMINSAENIDQPIPIVESESDSTATPEQTDHSRDNTPENIASASKTNTINVEASAPNNTNNVVSRVVNNNKSPDKLIGKKEIQITNTVKIHNFNEKQTNRQENEINVSKGTPKSNIPKLIKIVSNNKMKGDKSSPKVLSSKVPVRRNSLKQYPAPQPPKSQFGHIQSGFVKHLQSRLFSTKSSKANINSSAVDVKPTTSGSLSKKKPAPQPPKSGESKVPSLPKSSPTKEKKDHYFRETCRTEDEWTESEAEDSPLRTRNASEEKYRAPTPPPPITLRRVSGQIVDLAAVQLPEGSPERQARMILAEGATETWEQAQLAVELVSRGAEPPAALLAALECADLDAALAYLHQDCELCASKLPEYEMVSMLRCIHRCCRECAHHYFTVQITERSIADCVCPYCKVPELESLPEDEWLEYFAHLDILLKTLLDTDVHELFQRKLRDRTLARDPNFRWCMECSSGFFVHPKQKKLRCPECRSVSCATCRKTWTSNHEGLTCDQYTKWLEDNDPELSMTAVQQHLRENGLECPRCHFKYSLSRGGCMHFTCTQCKYEFCYGCGKPFTMGARCGLSEYCAKLGLHSHHPRNCLFYLRDKEPHELQTLLQMNNVTYETESPEGCTKRCPIQLQRETPTGLVDGTCGGDVPPNHAGLCKNHYLEYLSRLVRRRGVDPLPLLGVDDLETLVRRAALRPPPRPYGSLEGLYKRGLVEVCSSPRCLCRGHYVEYLAGLARGLDPIPIMDVPELVAELRRRALPLPERGPWDTDPIYAGMCAEIVKEKIPLD